MILEAEQAFTLAHPAGPHAALRFMREPGRSLSRLNFIRDLRVAGAEMQGTLVVAFPTLGEVTLPFRSHVEHTPDGARLVPQPIPDERAWVEVGGQAALNANAQSGSDLESQMHFEFSFRAHLQVPEAEGWGGAAFEKMIRAAASRTLNRLAAALPEGLREAAEAEAEAER